MNLQKQARDSVIEHSRFKDPHELSLFTRQLDVYLSLRTQPEIEAWKEQVLPLRVGFALGEVLTKYAMIAQIEDSSSNAVTLDMQITKVIQDLKLRGDTARLFEAQARVLYAPTGSFIDIGGPEHSLKTAQVLFSKAVTSRLEDAFTALKRLRATVGE